MSHGVAQGGCNCYSVGIRHPKSYGVVLQAQMEELLASVEEAGVARLFAWGLQVA